LSNGISKALKLLISLFKGYAVPTQPQHFPPPVQHQQQMQPSLTPSQAVSQIMTPTPVDPNVLLFILFIWILSASEIEGLAWYTNY
jgi:hypothetical protein